MNKPSTGHLKKWISIAGTRYTVCTRSYDDMITLRGPGILGGLSVDVPFDSPNLRAVLIDAIAKQKIASQSARDCIAKRQDEGNT